MTAAPDLTPEIDQLRADLGVIAAGNESVTAVIAAAIEASVAIPVPEPLSIACARILWAHMETGSDELLQAAARIARAAHDVRTIVAAQSALPAEGP